MTHPLFSPSYRVPCFHFCCCGRVPDKSIFKAEGFAWPIGVWKSRLEVKHIIPPTAKNTERGLGRWLRG